MFASLLITAGLLAAPSPLPEQVDGSVWDQLAECESGGNWSSTAGQYEGGLQFANSTWLANGGGQYAQHAYNASREQQIDIALRVYNEVGWSAWPGCASALGLSGAPDDGGSGGGSDNGGSDDGGSDSGEQGEALPPTL
jgi:hypothetical protein